jgi:4-hydroxyphenylacetate decarboxylase small subunit
MKKLDKGSDKMRHYDCKNYINLDCEKGMCALSKAMVFIDEEQQAACPKFVVAEKCGVCKNFQSMDTQGIGICIGFEKENWTYSSCGASTCKGYMS